MRASRIIRGVIAPAAQNGTTHVGPSLAASVPPLPVPKFDGTVVATTLADVRALTLHTYGERMWARIQPPSKDLAQLEPGAPRKLLHVTSLHRPRASDGRWTSPHEDDFFTLQVTGADALRHPLDRFVLCFSRAVASEVVYSGRVLREEADLRCEYDAALDPGLRALREAHGLSPLPAVLVLTRTPPVFRDPSSGAQTSIFAHALLDAYPDQRIDVVYGEAFGAALSAHLGERSVELLQQKHDGWAVLPLSLLVERTVSAAAADKLKQPNKLIRLRASTGASAQDVLSRAAHDRPLGVGVALSAGVTPNLPLWMQVLSIEAGPSLTRQLYGLHLLRASGDRAAFEDVLVDQLLLTVHRGHIEREKLPCTLVYPSRTSGTSLRRFVPGGDSPPAEYPPPTLTQTFLDRHYRLVHEHVCEIDPDWSFLWLERK